MREIGRLDNLKIAMIGGGHACDGARLMMGCAW
jgi:hypothetical protein